MWGWDLGLPQRTRLTNSLVRGTHVDLHSYVQCDRCGKRDEWGGMRALPGGVQQPGRGACQEAAHAQWTHSSCTDGALIWSSLQGAG